MWGLGSEVWGPGVQALGLKLLRNMKRPEPTVNGGLCREYSAKMALNWELKFF